MEIIGMDGCCKAAILCEFGGGEAGDPGTFKGVFVDDNYAYADSLAEAKEDWREQCEAIFNELKARKRSGETLIVFATTTHQPWARKFLRAVGFKKTERQQTSGGRPLDGWYLAMRNFNPDGVKL